MLVSGKSRKFYSLSLLLSPSKEVWIGWISSLAEAYNMALYSFLAPLLAIQLFPEASPQKALFFSYFLMFVGACLLYPLGAFYYGFMGDRQGRQKACIYSTLGLGIATGLMGVLPFQFFNTYSWIVALLLISAQYFFSGGEYYGSIVFSLEHAKQKAPGLLSAFSCLFAVGGLASANGLAAVALIKKDPIWIHVCFFLGAAGGIVSYFLKNFCRETPAFQSIASPAFDSEPFFQWIKEEWLTFVQVLSVFTFFIVSYAFIFIFLPLAPLQQTTQNFDTFIALLAYGAFLILGGWMADHFGLQNTLLAGLALFSFAALPACLWTSSLLSLQLILTPLACLVIGPIHGWMLHQFPVQKRCRGVFIASAIATSLFGGSTVPLCLLILDKTSSLALCSLYPTITAICAFSCLLFFQKSPRK